MKKFKFPIDLSMLTEEEINQFREDPSTLFQGEIDVCLYLRFSSERQKEQSIEGQLRDCIAHCKRKSYRIVAIFVDRATTARKDVEKRVHFQEMITASVHQTWKLVIVWKLDRFARNREDSAVFKMRLRKNGVKVESATEGISKNPEGIILEAVLEGIAEYYSADLSQKITRGMRESALKCHSIGGHVPLGYKIEDHRLVINPNTAHIVQEAFELYANGETVADICRMFNTKGYRTAKGAEFNRNSFKSMFRNKRYIGVYTYKEIEKEGGVPAIIDKELFETVQRRLSANAEAPARGKAKVDYLLSGKLFCGHCGASMNGESGAGRHGKVYHYYSCYTKKRKLGCDKRPLKKDYIEGIVARDALNLLTDQLIDEIADMAIRQSEQDLINDTHIPQLTAQLSEVEKSITNITAAIEKGIASETLMNRLVQLEHEKKTLNKEIKAEEKFVYRIDRDQIVFWLSQFKYGNIEDEDFRRRLIDLLVNSVTVWDEPDGYKITTAYNLTSCKTKTFRVEKNPAAEEATGFDFGGSECTKSPRNRLISRTFAFHKFRF
jgi:DNA invertase Pin-like site-specific DNA recombinase